MKSSNVYNDSVHDIAIKQAKYSLDQCYSTTLMLFFFIFGGPPLICSLPSIGAMPKKTVRRVKRKFGQ